MSSALSTLNTTTEMRPLSKAPNPQLLPGRRSINGCPLLHVCVPNSKFHTSRPFLSLFIWFWLNSLIKCILTVGLTIGLFTLHLTPLLSRDRGMFYTCNLETGIRVFCSLGYKTLLRDTRSCGSYLCALDTYENDTHCINSNFSVWGEKCQMEMEKVFHSFHS